MTYFEFLLRFLVVPIIVLLLLILWDRRRGKMLPDSLRGYSPLWMLAALVVIALVYTTPWDNYLVATGVWWYDPTRVTGITLGWVPLEEYTFFVLQPIMVGLWALWLAPRLPAADPAPLSTGARTAIIGTVAAIWLVMVVILFSGWMPGKYLSLELAWGLIPILIQLVFGIDTLWQQRRLVAMTIIPASLYLSLTDAFAIGDGIWTIDPAQSLGILIGGQLPIEEAIFFTLTTTLVTVGLILGIALRSREQLRSITVKGITFGSTTQSRS
jgi:lycopene cyclase domain-containing protein